MPRPSVWTLDREAPGGRDEDEDEDDCDHEDEMLVLKAADDTEVRFMLADRLVLAHLAADGRGSTGRGAEPATHPGRRAAD